MEKNLVKLSDQDPLYKTYLIEAMRGGQVEQVGEHTTDTAREVVFAVHGPSGVQKPRRVNPEKPYTRKWRVTPEMEVVFCQNAKRAYQANWRTAWWREVVQNSIDAGATEIRCGVDTDVDVIRVTCADNGKGMDAKALADHFLSFGGTGKAGDRSSVGGFGKAKELIFLPWLHYEVESRDNIMRGSGLDLTEPEPTGKYLHGTRVTVWMKRGWDNATDADSAKSYIRLCYAPDVAFFVNGQVVNAGLAAGSFVRKFTAADDSHYVNVHYDESREDETYNAKVRVATETGKFIFMFNLYVGETVPGLITLEVYGKSYSAFTDNRQGWADKELEQQVQAFCQQLAVDVRSALDVSKNVGMKPYGNPDALISADDFSFAAEILDCLPSISDKYKKADVAGDEKLLEDQELPGVSIKEVVNMLRGLHTAIETGASPADVDESTLPASLKEIAKAILADEIASATPGEKGTITFLVPAEAAEVHLAQPVSSQADVENMVKALAWVPKGYVTKNEIPYFDAPAAYSTKLSVTAQKLLTLWTEFCRFVLIVMGRFEPFCVGFLFSKNYSGQCVKEKGKQYLLFNPLVVTSDSDDEKKFKSRPLVRFGDEDAICSMFATAMHEVMHLFAEYHNEVYAHDLTVAIAKILPKWNAAKKLKPRVLGSFAAERQVQRKRVKDIDTTVRDVTRKLLPASTLTIDSVVEATDYVGSSDFKKILILALVREMTYYSLDIYYKAAWDENRSEEEYEVLITTAEILAYALRCTKEAKDSGSLPTDPRMAMREIRNFIDAADYHLSIHGFREEALSHVDRYQLSKTIFDFINNGGFVYTLAFSTVGRPSAVFTDQSAEFRAAFVLAFNNPKMDLSDVTSEIRAQAKLNYHSSDIKLGVECGMLMYIVMLGISYFGFGAQQLVTALTKMVYLLDAYDVYSSVLKDYVNYAVKKLS